MYSESLVNVHFWLATIGTVVYVRGDVGLRHHAGSDVA